MILNCPLCGKECKCNPDHETNSVVWKCDTFYRSFRMDKSVYSDRAEQTIIRKMNNLILEFVLEKPYADEQRHLWWFFYEEGRTYDTIDRKVNLANIHYPMTLAEKIDRILLNLYYYKQDIGHGYSFDSTMNRALFAESESEERNHGIVYIMQQMEYLTNIYVNSLIIIFLSNKI